MPASRMIVLPLLAIVLLGVSLGPGAAAQVEAQDAANQPAAGATIPRALQPDGDLPLAGTPWRLLGYRYKGVDREPGPEVAARLLLADGKLRASGGCTAFRGTYATVGAAVSFRLKGLKDNDCGEQTTIVQLGMVDGLRKAAEYEIGTGEDGADELILRSAGGLDLLRFGLDEVGALDAAEWRLEAYTSGGVRVAASPEQPAVMSFRAGKSNDARRSSNGRFTASSGCNAIVGDYFRRADVISFGELERTDAPCSGALQAQEGAMVSVLDATALSVSLTPDRLLLTSSDAGDSLELISSQPLEGSTWSLTKFPGLDGAASPVALWLEDGQTTGEGPCGSFSADYVTDGLFMTLTDVSGTGDDTCAAADVERSLLAALRATVSLDRDQPQLRFLDARGRIVARFRGAAPP